MCSRVSGLLCILAVLGVSPSCVGWACGDVCAVLGVLPRSRLLNVGFFGDIMCVLGVLGVSDFLGVLTFYMVFMRCSASRLYCVVVYCVLGILDV